MNGNALRLFQAVLAVTLLLCAAAHAAGDSREKRVSPSIFEIATSRGGRSLARGTAVAIARQGWLMTSATLVNAGDEIIVSERSIGAIAATVVATDPAADLALLHIDVKLHPAVLARQEPAAGGIVSAVGTGRGGTAIFTSGALGQMLEAAGPSLSHNALFGSHGYGGPLINECGEVIGLDRTNENGAGGVFAPPQNYALAATIGQIEALATRNGVKFVEAKSDCVPALVAAEHRADVLHNSQIATLKEKQEADASAAAARRDAKAAEIRQHSAQMLAEQRQHAADVARRVSERTRRLSYWGAGIAVLLLLIAASAAYFLVSRHRASRRDAESQAEAARLVALKATTPPEGAHDLLLEGRAPDGEAIAIKIPALALGETHGGAIIGRSPDESEFVINRQAISRKHLRLFVADGTLMVEDLDSTNGTFLNSVPINTAMAVHEGDVIGLDDLALRLSYREKKKTTSVETL